MFNLELYEFDMDREPLANVICCGVPRVDEYVELLAGETNKSGLYRVLHVRHVLDPRKVESAQHVCLIVIKSKN